jgi:hypothetical protein
MIVNWNFYISRKRIIVKDWLRNKNIVSYKQLTEVTEKLGIETPEESKVSKYFIKEKAIKNEQNNKVVTKQTIKGETSDQKLSDKTMPDDNQKGIAKISEKPKRRRKRKTSKT